MQNTQVSTRGFYVLPEIMRDFAGIISRNGLYSHQIRGTSSSGYIIIIIAYDENGKTGIDELMQLNCPCTREFTRVETLNYDFSVPPMNN